MKILIFRVDSSKGKVPLLLFISILFIFFFYRGVHNIGERVLSIEIYSESFGGNLVIKESNILRKVEKELSRADITSYNGPVKKKFTVVVKRKKRSQMFRFDTPDELVEMRTGKLYRLKDSGKCLEDAVKQLELKNPFGEFLTWDEVQKIFKKYDKAMVIDFETGMSFMVQRRAGSRHADVQPLTAEDSDIMKIIYGGKWSWKRRAVIVETGGRRIAGSMNGMPHGAGAISGNKFNGHFCIHFRDSSLHRNREDLAHQLMVWKAAGTVDKMMASADPETIIRVMFVALEQGDSKLVARFIQPVSETQKKELECKLKSIKWITVSVQEPKTQKKALDFSTKVSCRLSDGTQYNNRPITFKMVRVSDSIRWKIDINDVLQLFDKPKPARVKESLPNSPTRSGQV